MGISEDQKEKPAIFVFTTAYEPYIGGAEIAIKEVTKRLEDEFRFFIFTSRFRPNLPKMEEKEGVVIRRIGLGFFFDKFLIPFFGFFVVRRYMRRENPALFWPVMATYASGIPYLINIFRLAKPIPVVLTLQEGDPVEHIKKAKFGLIGLSWSQALGRTSYLTAISTFLLNLGKEFGYKGEGKVIPNGVDVSEFTKEFMPDELRLLRDGLDIGSNEKVVITTSRLVEKNAVDILIWAVSILLKKGRRIKLLILGSGDNEKALRALADRENITEHILFLGDVRHSEIPKYLNVADVFVRPSRSEGLGNSFIEAMAAGVPIVGTLVGGIVDFLEDGKTGLAVNVDDPSALASKIENLFDDQPLRERLISNAQQVALTRYQWGMIANDYGTVFRSTVAEAGRHSVLISTGAFPPDIGGPATYTKILADELPGRGINVSVVNFGNFRHLPKGIRHAAYFWNVFKEARQADTIFAQDPVSVGLPSMLAAKILGRKFALKVVGDYAWEQGVQRFGVSELLDEFLTKRYGFRVGLLRKTQTLAAKAASAVIVPSNYLKAVVAKWGVPESKIRVVLNSFEAKDVSISKAETRTRLGLNGIVAISAGRFVPWKGFETLIDAVSDVLVVIPDFRLIIAGSGPEEEHLKSKAKTLGLENAVSFVGQIPHDELIAYFRVADFFVLNTGYEGLSHTLLEAMASGLPVITTRVGGNPEVVVDGQNGILIPYNDRKALSEAITGLCRNRELRERLSAEAQKTLVRFSEEKMVADTLAILRSL